jgi:integrase
MLSDHIRWLLELGLRPATINTGHVAVIKAILRHAYDRGLIDRVPASRKLPVELDEPDAWSPAQIAAFIEACPAAWDKPIAGIAAGDWWSCLAYIVWYSGIRRRAVLAIRRNPPDVDLQTGWLHVPGSSMKNRRGQKFRLGDDALAAIARIWQPARELLLPFPHDKGTFYDQFHRIREAAGLPVSTSHMGCLHLMRRSTATSTPTAAAWRCWRVSTWLLSSSAGRMASSLNTGGRRGRTTAASPSPDRRGRRTNRRRGSSPTNGRATIHWSGKVTASTSNGCRCERCCSSTR